MKTAYWHARMLLCKIKISVDRCLFSFCPSLLPYLVRLNGSLICAWIFYRKLLELKFDMNNFGKRLAVIIHSANIPRDHWWRHRVDGPFKSATHYPSWRPSVSASESAVSKECFVVWHHVIVMASANVVCLKKRRKIVRKRKLLLSSLTFAVMANEQRKKKRTCWTQEWICRHPTLGFTTTRIHELQTEDAAEFRTMFPNFVELLHMVSW